MHEETQRQDSIGRPSDSNPLECAQLIKLLCDVIGHDNTIR